MLHLVGSYDHAKSHLGVFWRVIMFGCYTALLKFEENGWIKMIDEKIYKF